MQRTSGLESLGSDDTREDLYLTFSIENDIFGISIDFVKEIIGLQSITEIPDFPAYMKGIINLRGKIVPVMDVRLRFKKPERAYDARTCIIVVDILDTSIGLIVDRVDEVLNIPESNIAAPPEINKRELSYIKGFGKVGDGIKLLLDCGVLLGEDAEVLKQQKEENEQ